MKRGKAPTLPDVVNGEIFQNVGKYARGAVLFAFQEIGGAEGLARWADSNPDEFYTKLFPKIITRETEVTHRKSVDELMDALDGDYEVVGEPATEDESREAEEMPVTESEEDYDDPDWEPEDMVDFDD